MTKRIGLRFLLFVVVSLAGCQTNGAAKARLGQQRPAADSTRTYRGYLEIDPLVWGKGSQAARLRVARDRWITLEMRYTARHLRYANKRVVVRGGMASSATETKVQAYRYFKIESISLAAGETRHRVEPSSVPAPPLVRSREELESLRGQWAMLVGKARYTFDRSGVASVRLVLSDGFAVAHPLHRGGTREHYRDGQTATLLARYRVAAKPSVRGYGFCRGEVPRCGMRQQKR